VNDRARGQRVISSKCRNLLVNARTHGKKDFLPAKRNLLVNERAIGPRDRNNNVDKQRIEEEE
jgi:hypothetical protein